jgi:hypothetical protein
MRKKWKPSNQDQISRVKRQLICVRTEQGSPTDITCLRPANMIYSALDDVQNNQLYQINFFTSLKHNIDPPTLAKGFVRPVRPRVFKMWPSETIEFETPEVGGKRLALI